MSTNDSDILSALAALQAELRGIPTAGSGGAPSVAAGGGGIPAGLPKGPAAPALRGIFLGCRLFHWNPELEDAWVDVIYNGRPERFKVYWPFNRRVGGRPHVFFEKVYKTNYLAPGRPRSGAGPERQFGITYPGLRPKPEVKPLLDAFKQCASAAGALVASVKERLAPALPAATLAAKQDLHRWIFTVYDIAWGNPPGSPLAATRYIPLQGFDAGMRTDESMLYDLDHLRSTPWAAVERRLDPNRRGTAVHLKEAYESWGVELPEYYASRIDDIVRASDLAIDWLVEQLQQHG